jgi:hypothetical protein
MKRSLVPVAAGLLPVVMFLLLPPLDHAGLWDPHELRVADLAHGHVDATAQPPLALYSIALGLRIFGPHEWGGRAPLALWGIAGVLATYAWVSRLVARRAGLYAAVALCTMPLYFVQARTMLGGIVGMSAVSASFGALAVACLGVGGRGRVAWLGLAALALVAGLGGAGALLGVALPAFAVGCAWAIGKTSRARPLDRLADVVGAASLGLGVLVAVLAWRASVRGGTDAALVLGAVPSVAVNTGFARVLGRLGHALAPWSAFAPLALGRLFVSPPTEDEGARQRESSLRVALLIATGAALAVHTWLGAAGVEVPFVAPAMLAATAAIALFDFERGAPASVAVGASTAVLLGVLYVDFRSLPDETLAPFAVGAATLPDGFRATAEHSWGLALGVFALVALGTWVERAPERRLFDRGRIARGVRAVLGAWEGNAWRVYAALVAAAVVATVAIVEGSRLHQRWAMGVAVPVRGGVYAAAAILLALPVLPLAASLLCDAVAWVAARVLRGRRGGLLVLGGLASGLVLSLWQYSALATQLSPRGALETYARARREGDSLGLLGVSERAAASALGPGRTKPEVLASGANAYAWLGAAPAGQRRFVLTDPAAFASLNQIYRERSPGPHANAPVIDARSSDTLLVTSSLRAGEKDENPWNAFTLRAPPSPQHAVDADLSGQVAIVGWDMVDEGGGRADAVVPGRAYTVRVYLRVEQRPTTEWQAFVHVDGHGRRHTADHPLLGGKYQPRSWVAGDLLVDAWELKLPPNFTPGAYRLYYGLWFPGDESRLKVTRGPNDGVDRVDFGNVKVR